ncbi:MAG: hypothetical protein ABT01_00940 [Clostridium sp. SCN 57-10]|nr:MAG: hypothetical protein ABT01_00940 [Clostridium sp. SCN 57-10]
MQMNIKLLRDGAAAPEYQTAEAAALDLCACLDAPVTIAPGERAKIGTGVAVELPHDCAGFVMARSGLSSRHGVALANGVGLIDPDYRGEVCATLQNNGREPFTVNHGDRVAQLCVVPFVRVSCVVCSALSETERGENGHGSTGVR